MSPIIMNVLFILLPVTSIMSQAVHREMLVNKEFLNLPVSHDADRARMTLKFEDGTVRNFTIRLSQDKPDYWVFVDLSRFIGQKLRIAYPEDRSGIEMIFQDDQIAGSDSLYQEMYRPGFHFTSKRGWNNDPNGLVYSMTELKSRKK